jgi:hypothetical protein
MPLGAAVLRAQDFMGRTPLHAAQMFGYSDAAAVLMKAARDVSAAQELALAQIKDKGGKLHHELLPQHGAGSAAKHNPAAADEHRSVDAVGDSDSNGGWGDHAANFSDVGFSGELTACDIDVVQGSLPPSEFLMKYLVAGRPVLMKRAAKNWPFRQAWAKAELLKRHGDLHLPSGAIPYAAAFGLHSTVRSNQSLREFVRRMEQPQRQEADADAPAADTDTDATAAAQQAKLVLVDALRAEKVSALKRRARAAGVGELLLDRADDAEDVKAAVIALLLPAEAAAKAAAAKAAATPSPPPPPQPQPEPPSYIFYEGAPKDLQRDFPVVPPFLTFPSPKLVERVPSAIQFYLGPAGSGAPVHFHCDAWNALAHGRKQWLLFPPAQALYSATPIGRWVRGEYRPATATAGDSTAGAPSGGGAKQAMVSSASKAMECVQEAGDVLYVPCDWVRPYLLVTSTAQSLAENP